MLFFVDNQLFLYIPELQKELKLIWIVNLLIGSIILCSNKKLHCSKYKNLPHFFGPDTTWLFGLVAKYATLCFFKQQSLLAQTLLSSGEYQVKYSHSLVLAHNDMQSCGVSLFSAPLLACWLQPPYKPHPS